MRRNYLPAWTGIRNLTVGGKTLPDGQKLVFYYDDASGALAEITRAGWFGDSDLARFRVDGGERLSSISYARGALEGGDSDVKTHAFWAKDEDSKEGYLLAREFAIHHVLKEVETLWTRAETLGDLRDIFGMTYSQLEERRVLYKNTDKCELCPF